MKKTALLLYFLILCFTKSYSQITVNDLQQNEVKSTHYYTFEASSTPEKIEELEKSLAKLEFVTQAKVKYKLEKGMGQVILMVSQPRVIRENQKEFSPTIIKKTLINFGFTPVQYSIEK